MGSEMCIRDRYEDPVWGNVINILALTVIKSASVAGVKDGYRSVYRAVSTLDFKYTLKRCQRVCKRIKESLPHISKTANFNKQYENAKYADGVVPLRYYELATSLDTHLGTKRTGADEVSKVLNEILNTQALTSVQKSTLSLLLNIEEVSPEEILPQGSYVFMYCLLYTSPSPRDS